MTERSAPKSYAPSDRGARTTSGILPSAWPELRVVWFQANRSCVGMRR
ncbi:Hypothetical protein A7982_05524 [Minicystis rosea]|nr:Hypothetical protein A7982_05524 [Minicystis rosea]